MRWTSASPTPVPENSSWAVQALEDTEQFVRMAHVEARAVVFDIVESLAVFTRPRADLDLTGIARRW